MTVRVSGAPKIVSDGRVSMGDVTLDAIESMTDALGYPPSTRELAAHFGVSFQAIYCRLLRLRHDGRITWTARKSRTLRVVRDGDANAVPTLPLTTSHV